MPDDVAREEKERRDQVLLADQERRGRERNSKLIGSVREVMVEGPSKRNKERLAGRESGNRIVVWDISSCQKPVVPGEITKIKITDAHAQILVGVPAQLDSLLI
jgi:tRNA-2-methylthio-N6-dimethylallyladenosine synthase